MLARRIRFDKPGRQPSAAWGAKKPDPLTALPLTRAMEAHFEALLELLYSTGLRRAEVANLRRYDADLVRLVVFVREGKGRKDRVVPLGARAAA